MSTETLTHHDPQKVEYSDDVFGFWLYIMTDCVLFAALFATFIVLRHHTYGAPGMKTITNLPYVFGETMLLLCSSLTCGMAVLSMYQDAFRRVLISLAATWLLGLAFVIMEIFEFYHLVVHGHGPQASAALSAFFTLVGTHGLHVSLGLLWIMILMVQLFIFKLKPMMRRRLTYFALFWAFLDIIWIFVFTTVYLMGVV